MDSGNLPDLNSLNITVSDLLFLLSPCVTCTRNQLRDSALRLAGMQNYGNF